MIAMTGYPLRNLKEVENAASKFGLAPGFRIPFGHHHKEQEEIYVLVEGSGRMKLDDEIVELRRWDAIRVAKETTRNFEAGPEGATLIAFGAPGTGPGDAEMEPGWWSG